MCLNSINFFFVVFVNNWMSVALGNYSKKLIGILLLYRHRHRHNCLDGFLMESNWFVFIHLNLMDFFFGCKLVML